MNNVIFMTERHCFQNLSEVVTKSNKMNIISEKSLAGRQCWAVH